MKGLISIELPDSGTIYVNKRGIDSVIVLADHTLHHPRLFITGPITMKTVNSLGCFTIVKNKIITTWELLLDWNGQMRQKLYLIYTPENQ